MNKKLKWLVLSPLILASSSSLASCSNNDGYLLLRVINSEDYIYLNDPTDPESAPALIHQFEDSEAVKEFLETKYPQYKGVKVIYDTSDTNETLYSELQTGKTNYDLMNVSDYMAQKIVSNGLAVPLYEHDCKIENYFDYASVNIKTRLDNIIAKQKYYDSEEGKIKTKDLPLADYAVGYMWVTLGILFNPNYSEFSASMEEAIYDMQSYGALWDSKYKGTISIKNSMRDTYAAALLYRYRDEFEAIRQEYIDAGKTEEALKDYLDKFSKIFNRCSESEVAEVKEALDALKLNIFGLEVDSGKQDIITQKIGINLAWSGDAVYSMDQAEDPEQVKNPFELYYSVPELGSNLWFDTWVMPKNDNRSEERRQLALMFLDFISDPVNAAQNMDYTGYTSFIGGDSVLELVRDWYDARTDELYEDDYQIYAVGPGGDDDFFALDYPDCVSTTHQEDKNGYLLYYSENDPEDVTIEDFNEETAIYVLDEEGEPTEEQKTYGELLLADQPGEESDIQPVDLSYFFNETLDEYEDNVDTIFYSDDYLKGEFVDPNSEEASENVSVGRQFFTQYPDERTLNRCAVMRDYGENNKYVMKMWEEFKSDPLPTPAIVIFVIIIAAAIGFIAFVITGKVLTNNIRKRRKKAQN